MEALNTENLQVEDKLQSSLPAQHGNRFVGPRVDIRVAHGIDELLMALAIRSAVFLAEQSCPYAEEFDGNDMCATHVIGFVDDEPAATIRIRYFGEFVKMERMAVRREFRGSPITTAMLDYVVEFARRKGFTRIMVHTQTGRERFWRVVLRKFGGYRPIPGVPPMQFSGHSYQPIELAVEPRADSFAMDSDPFVLNREEGEWDMPGVLERSVGALPEPARKVRI